MKRRVAITLLGVVAAIPAALQLARLASILWSRLSYPYDVHFVEGATLLHVHRLLHGQPMYPEPTENPVFVPSPYPPLLYFVIGALAAVFGLDYWTGRAVSVLATSVSALVLAHQVFRRFRGQHLPWLWSILTLGAIAAAFPLTVAWYDAAMCDPLALALTVVTGRTVLTSSGDLGRSRLLLVIALMVAIIFTKQNYALSVAWLLVFLGRTQPRQALLAGAAVVLVTLALFGLGQLATRGSFYHYVVAQLLQHPVQLGRLLQGTGVVAGFAPYVPLLFPIALVLALERCLSAPALLWSGLLLAAFPTGLLPYAKTGGGDNNLMPILVLAPAAWFCVLADAADWLAARARVRARAAVLVLTALLGGAYLVQHGYSPAPFVATSARRAAALELNRYVASLNGDVLIPARPLLAIRNGSRLEQVHVVGYYDLLFGGRLDVPLEDFLRRARPRYVLLTDQEPGPMIEAAAGDYFSRGLLPPATWPAQTLEQQIVYDDPTLPYFPGQLKWVLERSEPEPPGSRCLFEFESSSFEQWSAQGTGFGSGPTLLSSRKGKAFFANGSIVGVAGRAFASSGSGAEGERALGVLSSPEFVIDRPLLSLRFAGGRTDRTRVELYVDGKLTHSATGRGNDYLERFLFRLENAQGRSGQLKLIDEDTEAHASLDHVCLLEREQ